MPETNLQGGSVERIYQTIRALRLYEGASEIQRNTIARAVLREAK
ncbi:MAG: acyl-CoA dehydrogenase family protein [Thermodesulfobacteriota bacterium]